MSLQDSNDIHDMQWWSLIEVGIASVCLFVGITGVLSDEEDNPPILRFIAMHGPKVLIAFGVVATLLWLPWETYVQIPETQKSNDKFNDVKLEAVRSNDETQYSLM